MKTNKIGGVNSLYQKVMPWVVGAFMVYLILDLAGRSYEKDPKPRLDVEYRQATEEEQMIEYLKMELEDYGRVVDDKFWANKQRSVAGSGDLPCIESLIISGAENSCVLPYRGAQLITRSDDIGVRMVVNHTERLWDIVVSNNNHYYKDDLDWELIGYEETDAGMKSTISLPSIKLHGGFNGLEFLVRQFYGKWYGTEPFTLVSASSAPQAVEAVDNACFWKRDTENAWTDEDQKELNDLKYKAGSLFE